MSTRTAIGKPPMMTSRLTGARQTPTDAGDRQRSGGRAVFPRGEREQDTTCSRRSSQMPRGFSRIGRLVWLFSGRMFEFGYTAATVAMTRGKTSFTPGTQLPDHWFHI